ncbi:MAG: 4Fe-4S binding protein [Clostridiaceae bacterium]
MKNKTVKTIRLVLITIFLTMITIVSYLHQVLGGGEAPSIHGLCPYGALESLYSLIFNGTFVSKIFTGTMILLSITLIIAIIFRRSFCGLICPFGAFQEFFGIIGKKIFRKRFVVPEFLDKPFRYIKYIVLIVTIYYAWKTAGLWIDPYDPWAAYGHITEGYTTLVSEYLIGSIILIIILIGSLLYDRFFCKYLCPMGAVYGIISKISFTKIVRNNDKCVNCGICSKNCPVNIKVSQLDEVRTAECISCNACVLSCPKKGALEIKTFKKSMKPLTIILLVVTLFVGTVVVSKISGIFEVTQPKVTSETKLTVEDLKGYMTIEDVSVGLKINLDQVYEKLDIPSSVAKETKLKDVKNFIEDFEVETAKERLEK